MLEGFDKLQHHLLKLQNILIEFSLLNFVKPISYCNNNNLSCLNKSFIKYFGKESLFEKKNAVPLVCFCE